MKHQSRGLKTAIVASKVLLAVAIVTYLVVKVQGDAGFTRLYREPKVWPLLAASLAMILVAFSCSFVRWFLLVRGLGLSFHLSDAFRLGSLGFMLNQVMPGSVGGDLFKAAFIAHEQPGRRTEAVATVIIDRFIGLVAMLVVASLALFVAGRALSPSPVFGSLKVFIWVSAAGGCGAVMALSSRLVSGVRVQQRMRKVPYIGHSLSRLVAGLHQFASRRSYLAGAFALATVTHGLFITSMWCIAQGLPIASPSFIENAAIVPVALVAGSMPLTPGGLGLTETALAKLYLAIGLAESDGALVALCYRALTYAVAGIGAIYYLSAKRRIDRLILEAEDLSDDA